MAEITFNSRDDDPADFIYGYFEDLATVNGMVVGVESLEELYSGGAPRRPADEYLWKLTDKLSGGNKFSANELNELKQQDPIIQAADSGYPEYLKNAVSELLRRVASRSEGRNLSSAKAAGILDTSARRENLIGNNRPAMKKALGMSAFPSMVGSFLTSEPRIHKESRGTVDPALRNLRLRSKGEVSEPLRRYGTGIGGRRKSRITKKPKRKTRKLK